MNMVVSGLEGCAGYLDDVVVHSGTWEVHADHIWQLFDCLCEANLTNLAKCEFAKAAITYLGKEIGKGQVRPVQAKVAAIEKYPVPETKKEFLHFLGLEG